MSKHIPEPWVVNHYDPGNAFEDWCIGIPGAPHVDDVASCGNELTSEANARRIVACVNACKGIKTEELESKTTVGLAYMAVADERDQLRAALERIRKRADAPGAATAEDAVYCFRQADLAIYPPETSRDTGGAS